MWLSFSHFYNKEIYIIIVNEANKLLVSRDTIIQILYDPEEEFIMAKLIEAAEVLDLPMEKKVRLSSLAIVGGAIVEEETAHDFVVPASRTTFTEKITYEVIAELSNKLVSHITGGEGVVMYDVAPRLIQTDRAYILVVQVDGHAVDMPVGPDIYTYDMKLNRQLSEYHEFEERLLVEAFQ